MFFLTPRPVKMGRAFIKDAKKLLAYKRDLLSEATVAEFEAGIQKLEAAVKTGESTQIEAAAHALDAQCGSFVKPQKDAGWRENCEVFLVAIVVALGVRTYFLQPFTIPTGSMQPTLNGILTYPKDEAPPNFLVQIFDFAFRGRVYVNEVAESDDVIRDVRAVKKLGIFDCTELIGTRSTYTVWATPDQLQRGLVRELREFKKGDVIVRGYRETGDHVFVDKMSYHFRGPKRGEVFVFNTQGIPKMGDLGPPPKKPSQFYIKRLAGVPGDELRIAEPELFINGQRAQEPGFARVMTAENGYHGYANGLRFGRFQYLLKGDDTLRLGAKQYFALGDNTFSSSDSRDWGTVPEQNLMGRGVFVYWPFAQHFGFIR